MAASVVVWLWWSLCFLLQWQRWWLTAVAAAAAALTSNVQGHIFTHDPTSVVAGSAAVVPSVSQRHVLHGQTARQRIHNTMIGESSYS